MGIVTEGEWMRLLIPRRVLVETEMFNISTPTIKILVQYCITILQTIVTGDTEQNTQGLCVISYFCM